VHLQVEVNTTAVMKFSVNVQVACEDVAQTKVAGLGLLMLCTLGAALTSW